MAAAGYVDARRELGVTADLEKRALVAMARRLPQAVNSDHLTALGLGALVLAGVAYALAGRAPAWLHVVNVALLLNWFGDSLDGTVARVRDQQRPRYGFYVDHVVDAFGALFVMAGVALSGLMSPWLAVAMLVAYQLMAINVALATHTRGVFKIGYGGIGGTEIRILLAAANLVVFVWPRVELAGRTLQTFDVFGAGTLVALVVVLLRSVVQNTVFLYRLETT